MMVDKIPYRTLVKGVVPQIKMIIANLLPAYAEIT